MPLAPCTVEAIFFVERIKPHLSYHRYFITEKASLSLQCNPNPTQVPQQPPGRVARFLLFDANKYYFLLFNSSLVTKLHFQCGVKGSGGEDYIIGGEDTEENEYPWQVK